MNKVNIRYIKKCITSAVTSGLLTYFLFKQDDLLSKIIISLFLVFAMSFCATNILLVFRKNEMAKKVSKIYVIAFFIYWYGFLIYWDYLSILNKDFMSVLFSLIMWFAGGFFIYRRFIKKGKIKGGKNEK